MSFGETIFLFVLALIVFGPKKLPEIARTVGKYLNEFKRASNEFKSQIEQEISHLDTAKPQILTPTLTSSSWAGDRHTTEGLAPEGTASRSLASASTNSEPAPAESTATLAAPLIEDSIIEEPIIEELKDRQNRDAAAAPGEAATKENAPLDNSPSDSVTTPSAQESHA